MYREKRDKLVPIREQSLLLEAKNFRYGSQWPIETDILNI